MLTIVLSAVVLFAMAVGLRFLLDYLDFRQTRKIIDRTKSPNSVYFPQWPPE